MSIVIDAAPEKEPITLEFTKSQLNVYHDSDDTLLQSYIGVARNLVEKRLSRALITQTWDWSFRSFSDEMFIPLAPLQSITSVSYIDENGATQVLSSAVYDVDVGVEPGIVRLAYSQSWPSVRDVANAVTIEFVSGYGLNPNNVPFVIRQALVLYVGHLYQNREATSMLTIKEVPMAFESLMDSVQWTYL